MQSSARIYTAPLQQDATVNVTYGMHIPGCVTVCLV